MKLLRELVEFCEKGANLQKDLKGDVLFIPSGAVFPESIKTEKCYKILLSTTKLKEEYYLKKDDVLFNTGGVGTLGRVGFFNLDDKAVCDPFVLMIRGKKNVLYNRYLFYQLQTPRIKDLIFKNTVGSTGITAIKKSDILSFPIILPPYEEQKRIAAILDKAQSVVQNQKARIEKYDALAQSVFTEMFGDPEKNPKNLDYVTLKELCLDIVDCPHSTPKHSEVPTKYPSIRTTEISDGTLVWNRMKYVTEEGYKERTKRLIPQSGDIIYGREGTFGDAIVLPEGITACLGQRVMLFRPNPELTNSIYLWSILRSKYVYRQALKKTAGSPVGHVNVKDIINFKILFPKKQNQDKYSILTKNILSQKIKAIDNFEKSTLLFNSLLQNNFNNAE